MVKSYHDISGFSMIELLAVIVIIGIVAGSVLQYMGTAICDSRETKTGREMEMLSNAIVGNPSATQAGVRSDFGYIGDVGAFPPNLQALFQNPGLGTWDGPYIPSDFLQDSVGFKYDEWNKAYSYSGGITITSTGGGSTITKKIADATDDYLINTFNGEIKDRSDKSPGSAFADSVDIIVTFPNGVGGYNTRSCHPDTTGGFALDSLPVGQHPLYIIFTPNNDTLDREMTILPRNKGSKMYRFAQDYFSDTTAINASDYIVLTTSDNGTLGGLNFRNEDLIVYDLTSDTSSMYFDGSTAFSNDENVDAIHILDNGNIILSTEGTATIGAQSFDSDDLIQYNPATGSATRYLWGDTVFSNSENIDAVCVLDNGHIILSTTGSARIGGLNFDDDDLVDFNPSTGTASMYFDGSSHFSNNADIDAVHVLESGNILLSADANNETIAGLNFDDEDIIEYNPVSGTASMYFDGDGPFGTGNQNINGISFVGTTTETPSLVGHWMLDEMSGLIAHDSSGGGHDGTMTNMSVSDWTTGALNGALDFDGVNDYVNIGNQLSHVNALTVAVWVYPTDIAVDQQIVSKGFDGTRTQWELKTSSSDCKVSFRHWQPGEVGVQSIQTLPESTWTHVAGTYDGTTWKIYFNGVLDNQNVAGPIVETSRNLLIGAVDINGSPGQFWKGKLDDIRLYNYALDSAEIAQLALMGTSAGLVGYWKLDETSGTTAYDSSPIGNNGTLTSMDPSSDWVTGKIDGGLEFDGNNDRVIIADNDTLDNTQYLTVSVWAYPTTLDGNPRCPVSKRVDPSTQYSYSLFFYTGNRLFVDISGNDNRFSTNRVFTPNQWYHLAVVFDGTQPSASRVKVYVDGALDKTATESSSTIPNTSSQLVIGLLSGNNSGYFRGIIDDVRIYRKALSESQIQALYNMGN